MEEKLIFLDIDGTLTEPGSNEPPASALEAIRAAQKNGHMVFLCTGRNYDMLSPLLKYGFDGVISSSGGYVTCREEIVYDHPLSREQTEKALALLKENGIFFTIECNEGAFTDEGFKEYLDKNANEGSNSELLRWRRQIESSLNIKPMSDYEGQAVYKLIIMCDSLEKLELPRKELEKDFECCIQDPDGFGFVNGELIQKDFDKGRGIERMCAFLNKNVSDTIAFGDSMNDKEMMETAGISVCMENGSESLKKLADDICESVSKDGLYKAFRKYHLF